VERIGPDLLGGDHWVALRNLEYRFGVGISGIADLQHESFGNFERHRVISHLTHSGLPWHAARRRQRTCSVFEHDLFTVSP
jgi:hypothetical protein